MAAAAPVVGQMIVAVVVSKVASVAAEKLGMGESMSSLIGMGAGMYAGSMVPGGIGGPAAQTAAGDVTSGVGMDLSQGMAGVDLAMNAAPPMGQAAGTGLNEVGAMTSAPTVGGAAGPGGGLGMGAAPVAPPATPTGMLSQGIGGAAPQSALSMAGQAPVPGADTASQVIKAGTQPAQATGEKSWLEKLFSPENTLSMAMAGMAGAGEAGMREYEIDRPYDWKKEKSKGWKESEFGGEMKSLDPTYRSQGGSY